MNAKANTIILTWLVPLPELRNEVHIESEEAIRNFNGPRELMYIHHDAFVDRHSVGHCAVLGRQFNEVSLATRKGSQICESIQVVEVRFVD